MNALKITSRIFAVLAVIFVLIAILVAVGMLGSSNGFLDLSNIVAIVILGIALGCSVLASVTSLIYKLKIKALVKDSSAIGIIINAEKRGNRL